MKRHSHFFGAILSTAVLANSASASWNPIKIIEVAVNPVGYATNVVVDKATENSPVKPPIPVALGPVEAARAAEKTIKVIKNVADAPGKINNASDQAAEAAKAAQSTAKAGEDAARAAQQTADELKKTAAAATDAAKQAKKGLDDATLVVAEAKTPANLILWSTVVLLGILIIKLLFGPLLTKRTRTA